MAQAYKFVEIEKQGPFVIIAFLPKLFQQINVFILSFVLTQQVTCRLALGQAV